MFENYLNTFGNHHSKYFGRLTIKVKIMLGVVNEDFHLKNNNSFQLKKGNIKTPPQTIMNISPLIQNYETSDSETSSNGSVSKRQSMTTPSASMNDEEENNVRYLIGDMNENAEIKMVLDTILKNIPQNEESALCSSTRETIKHNINTIIEI